MQIISNSLAFGRSELLPNRGLRTQRGLLEGVGATLSLMGQAIAAIRRNGGTALYVPDDYRGAYIDSTGTQPVAAVGDLVGLLTDRSYGAGNLGPELWPGTSVTLAPETEGPFPQIIGIVPGKAYRIYCPRADVGFNFGVGWKTLAIGWNTLVADSANGRYRNWSTTTPITFTPSTREVLGNHATQATTANKPVVTRVPKRLGPNLVVNGDGISTTGWVNYLCTLASSGGEFLLNSASAVDFPNSETAISVQIGKSYQVTATGRRGTSTSAAYVSPMSGNNLVFATTSNEIKSATFTATTSSIGLKVGLFSTGATGTAYFDNISVQEVLEWTPALKFDGSNDLLTLSSGAILQQESDHFATVAGRLDAGATGYRQIYGSRNATNTRNVATITYNGATGKLSAEWCDNAGTLLALSEAVSSKGQYFVATAAKIGATRSLWVNGVLQASSTTALGATTVTTATLGASHEENAVRNYWSGEIIDIALGQSTLTDADRRTIERNMAQKAGATYVG